MRGGRGSSGTRLDKYPISKVYADPAVAVDYGLSAIPTFPKLVPKAAKCPLTRGRWRSDSPIASRSPPAELALEPGGSPIFGIRSTYT